MICDDELRRELDKIDAEAERRKKARPPEAYAFWKMQAQNEAIRQMYVRETVGASKPPKSENEAAKS